MNQTFKVIATGSKGNCYILSVEGETLLLECGISYKEILKGLNFNLSNVVGCLVTHEHKDHSMAIKNVLNNGIDVYASKGTLDVLDINHYRANCIESEKTIKIGKFIVMPFQVQHDAQEPLGFLIYHKAIGNLLFATDTYYLKYKFKNLNYIVIECNYAEDAEEINERLLKSHMSLDTLKKFMETNKSESLKEVLLIHISSRNGDPERFKKDIETITGVPVYIAEPGTEIGGVWN